MISHGFGAITVASVALLVLATDAGAEDPCRPVTPACTAGADERAQQAALAFTATDSGGLLRGMGLASLTGLLGRKKGKATEARLDDELVGQLVSAPVGPANLVSPTASLRREPRGAGAPAPGIVDVVQEAGHGKVKLHRQLHIEMDVDRCPKQLQPLERESNEHMAIAATYELVTSWREGKTSVASGVVIRLYAQDINVAVNQDARFERFKVAFPEVSVDRVGERVRPGRPPKRYSNTVNLNLNPAEVGWDVTRVTAAESWEAFTSGESRRPPGREPALISQKAYSDLVNAFMMLVDAELMKAVAKAEQVWQAPNACATVVWDPETGTAGVPPNAQIKVTGRIVPAGPGLNGLREHWAPVAQIGKIAEQLRAGSAEGEPMELRVEGGTPQDRITVKMHYRTPSTIGVVEGDWTAIDGINHVAGTIQGSIVDGTVSGDSRLDWTGNLAFDRDSPNDLGGANGIFLLASGDYEVTASGIHPPTGCQQTGVQHFVIPSGDNGQFAAQGIGPVFDAPYVYTFFAVIPGPTQMMNVTLFSCPDLANEGTVAAIDVPVQLGDDGGATSPDGVDFMDSYTRDTSDGAISASWSFHGS